MKNDNGTIDLDKKRRERAAKIMAKLMKEEEEKKGVGFIFGSATLEAIRPIIYVGDELFRYRDGLWNRMPNAAGRAWINAEIEKKVAEVEASSNSRTIEEARKWIMRNDEVHMESVPWDRHGLIITKNKWLDPFTGKTGNLHPELYATRRINCNYNPKAKCPIWLELLKDMFDTETISLLQEIAGLALTTKRPKHLSRALILWGGTNTGKSVIVKTIGGIISEKFISTKLDELDGSHGMSQFVTNDPWVLEEAFEQNKWNFSGRVKELLEGGVINVNRKNRDAETTEWLGAALWATNHAPSFREATKAIIERIIIILCKRVFDPNKPVGAALKIQKSGFFGKINEYLLQHEIEGILVWMIEGFKRVHKRGHYVLTEQVERTHHEVHTDSNVALGFFESGRVIYDPYCKVSVSDFCAAFSMWWRAEKGEDSRIMSNDSIVRSIKSMSDPKVIYGDVMRSHGVRYLGGFRLSKEALDDWQSVKMSQLMVNKLSGLSESRDDVNRPFVRGEGKNYDNS